MKKVILIIYISSLLLCMFSAPALAVESKPALLSKNYMLVNLESGNVLASQNIDKKIAPSSMVKIMTAIIALEHATDLDINVYISATAISDLENVTKAALKEGELISVRDLLYCVLVRSGADACRALAEHIAGSETDFVALMNAKAAELDMTLTSYKNSYGGDDEEQYTTVSDLYKLIDYARQNPAFMEICNTQYKYIPATNLTANRYYYSSNYLIISNQNKIIPEYYYRYANGIMSAYSSSAGYCVATVANKGGLNNICIVMNSQKTDAGLTGSYLDAKALLDWSFDNYKQARLVKAGDPITQVKVNYSAKGDHIVVGTAEDVVALIPFDLEPAAMEQVYELEESYDAPFEKGDIMGTVSYYYDDVLYATAELTAQATVERNNFLFAIAMIGKFFTSKPFLIGLGIFALVVIIYILLLANSNKNNRRRRQKNRPRYY